MQEAFDDLWWIFQVLLNGMWSAQRINKIVAFVIKYIHFLVQAYN